MATDPRHFESLRKKLTDTERLAFVCQYVKAALDTDSALHHITLLLGNAPADCGCRGGTL